jgi:tRNA 2-thiouridine synthesizing protein A
MSDNASVRSITADAILDCSGLYCPQPIIRTATRIKKMQPGQILEVRATDPGFQIDLPAWCISHQQEFLGIERHNVVFIGYVRLKRTDAEESER